MINNWAWTNIIAQIADFVQLVAINSLYKMNHLCYDIFVKLSIKYNLENQLWNSFVSAESADGGLLQSWNWGEFQISLKKKIFRLAVFDDNKLLAVALVIKQEMPLGFSYLYLPRGPVIAGSVTDSTVNDYLFSTIKKIAQAEKAIFLRLDPSWLKSTELDRQGMVSVGQVQPKSTLILDLNLTEVELLAQMKPKTRYNIKLAEKHKVKVFTSKKQPADLEVFWKLLQQTSERDNIKSHSRSYYEKMLKLPEWELVFAYVGDKLAAAAIMATMGEWRIYLHGASNYELREKMAPYLLQWEMIRRAKSAGLKYYDFWGVDEIKWPGVTRFKQGFAPKKKFTEYIGAYDLVYYKIFYKLYNLTKRFIWIAFVFIVSV